MGAMAKKAIQLAWKYIAVTSRKFSLRLRIFRTQIVAATTVWGITEINTKQTNGRFGLLQ